jgi:hypothetical protein
MPALASLYSSQKRSAFAAGLSSGGSSSVKRHHGSNAQRTVDDGQATSSGRVQPISHQSMIVLTTRAKDTPGLRTEDNSKSICPLGNNTNETLQRHRGEFAMCTVDRADKFKSVPGSLKVSSVNMFTSVNGLRDDIAVGFCGIVGNPSMGKGTGDTKDNDAGTVYVFGPQTTVNHGPDNLSSFDHIIVDEHPYVVKQGNTVVPGVKEVSDPDGKFRPAPRKINSLNVIADLETMRLRLELELARTVGKKSYAEITDTALAELVTRVLTGMNYPRWETMKGVKKWLLPLAFYAKIKLFELVFVSPGTLAEKVNAIKYGISVYNEYQEYEYEFIRKYEINLNKTSTLKPKPLVYATANAPEKTFELFRNLSNAKEKVQHMQSDYLNSKFAGTMISNAHPSKQMDVLLHAAHF